MNTQLHNVPTPKRTNKAARAKGTASYGYSQPVHSKVPDTLVVFSTDESIVELIQNTLPMGWQTERCTNSGTVRAALTKPGLRIIVIDDRAIDEGIRGWLLSQVRRWAPEALIVYIAAKHGSDVELCARCHGADYYFSQPLDHETIVRVLRSFTEVFGPRP